MIEDHMLRQDTLIKIKNLILIKIFLFANEGETESNLSRKSVSHP